jgi:hypothetical protein
MISTEKAMNSDCCQREGTVPPPFTDLTLQSALNELSEGAKLAVQTCLDLWREKVTFSTPKRYGLNFSMI